MTLVRVLETRKDYPPIEGTDEPRYAAAGDGIHVTPEQAAQLIADGIAKPYTYTVVDCDGNVFEMTYGDNV